MIRRILDSAKGLTLVELLATLAIFSLISVIIIGYLIGGMNNFKKVNEEIALHDEANYVMSEFVNYIFVATKIIDKEQTGCKSLIEVTDYYGNVSKLGFDNYKAVIIKNPGTEAEEKIELSSYTFSCGSIAKKKVENGKVLDKAQIKMFIRNEKAKYSKEIVLDSEVSFVNVE